MYFVLFRLKNSYFLCTLYLLIPEIDETSGEEAFHDREDHCHLLKRMAISIREGGPSHLHLAALAEVNDLYFWFCCKRLERLHRRVD